MFENVKMHSFFLFCFLMGRFKLGAGIYRHAYWNIYLEYNVWNVWNAPINKPNIEVLIFLFFQVLIRLIYSKLLIVSEADIFVI